VAVPGAAAQAADATAARAANTTANAGAAK
jgi:hypothetical protein